MKRGRKETRRTRKGYLLILGVSVGVYVKLYHANSQPLPIASSLGVLLNVIFDDVDLGQADGCLPDGVWATEEAF